MGGLHASLEAFNVKAEPAPVFHLVSIPDRFAGQIDEVDSPRFLVQVETGNRDRQLEPPRAGAPRVDV